MADELEIIASNREMNTVYAVPRDIENPEWAAEQLSPLLGIEQDALTDKLSGDKLYKPLKRKVLDEEWEVIEVEHYFEFPLWPDDLTMPWYCGIIDKVRRRKSNNGLGILDHKTASQLYGSKLEVMRLSAQFAGYQTYMQRFSKWKDETFDRSFVDFIQTSEKSQYGHDGLPLRREPIHATPAMLDQWTESTRYWVSMIEDVWLAQVEEHDLDPPMNTDNCDRFRSTCQFYQLCTQPKDTRAMAIEMAYHERHWDPRKRD